MGQKVTHLRRPHKHKKVDRLSKAERCARVAERREQWMGQWIALAKAFLEMLLNQEA